MEISKVDQIALDDALVAPANRLKIGKFNLRLSSDVTSKEATLQVVYDVLKLTPFYKAFQVSASTKHSKSRLILRLSQAQILWGMYNNKKVDYAYLLWEDFIYQIENTNTKKGNAMYYPCFTKLIVNFVMAKDPSIPRRNKERFLQRLNQDDDEAHTESEDDGDDFIHPKHTTHDDETTHEEETDNDDTFDPIVHTPSHVSSSDDEDSDNEVEGVDVEGEKSDEDATYVEDQGNEADRDTNANLEGRDDVMADVVVPQ
ncbi:hypothetical protein Tco_1412226, partial [Tanacetum coccineum]